MSCQRFILIGFNVACVQIQNRLCPISLLSTASIIARVEAFDKWRHKLVNQSQATSETAAILSIFLREVVY